MNAVNPAPSAAPSTSGDQRPYEPSMEEILASIRRIIADDQMLPGREAATLPPGVEVPPTLAAAPERSVSPPRLPAEAAASAPPAKMPEAQPMETSTLGRVAAPRSQMPAAPPLAPSEILRRARVEANQSTAFEPGASAAAEAASPPAAPPAHVAEAHTHPPEARPDEAPFQEDDLPGTAPTMHDPEPAEPEDLADGVDPYFDPPIERDEPLPSAEPPATLFSSHTKQSVSTAFNVLAATRLADNSEELLGLAREMIRPLLKTWLDDNLPSMVERMVRAEIERVARGGR